MCGTPDFEIRDFQAAVRFNLGAEAQAWFWSIVGEMTPEEKSMLLLFITGSGSQPAGGFQKMQRPIAIVASMQGPDSLPVTHTCFNTLELPAYSSREAMREKLLYAIRNCGATDFGMV